MVRYDKIKHSLSENQHFWMILMGRHTEQENMLIICELN